MVNDIDPYDKVLETFSSYSTHPGGKETTIFGRKEPGLHYVYSDRIQQACDWRAGEIAANESGAREKTARWFQNYLSACLGHPVVLKHIIIGANMADGYGYQIFGFQEGSQQS